VGELNRRVSFDPVVSFFHLFPPSLLPGDDVVAFTFLIFFFFERALPSKPSSQF